MSQHSFHIDNLAGAAFRAALNAALEALVTQSAGETAPATTYPFQVWADTAAGLIRQRNAANDGWVTLGTLGAPFFGLLPADIGPGTFLRRNAANTAYEALTLSDLLDLVGPTIGGYVYGSDDPDDPPPPSSHFIRCAAGLTGPGQYNEGKLRSESVSGSAPLINATAIVDDPDSPLYGRTIRLVETERRFLRPGNPGELQDDALQGHTFGDAGGYSLKIDVVGSGTNRSAVRTVEGTPLTIISDGTNGAPRIANETRPRNIGVAVYRRIK